MAVQKNKKSTSKRNMRRSHDFLKIKCFYKEIITKEIHLRHFITKNGFYKGKKIFQKK